MDKAKEARAIEYLRAFEPEDEPYFLCYSGGKDSDAIRILAQLAGVRHEIHHNLTTADAPETVRYIETIPDVIIDRPELTMWELIPKKLMPPTRLARYCCSSQKEHGGTGRLKITGVRWAESRNRSENAGLVYVSGKPKTMMAAADEIGAEYEENKKGGMILNNDNDKSRRFVEHCYRTTSTMVNPIVDWTDDDVWGFLHYYGCRSNPLYECGLKRVGCVGCPMAGPAGMKKGFIRWPKFRIMYVHAFDRMVRERIRRGLPNKWKNGEEVMTWWLGDDPDQIKLELWED